MSTQLSTRNRFVCLLAISMFSPGSMHDTGGEENFPNATVTNNTKMATGKNNTKMATGRYSSKSTTRNDPEKRLLDDLLKNYEKNTRPRKNSSESVVVTIGLSMSQLLEVDEKNQMMAVLMWFEKFWADEYLQWNPDDYGGVTTIKIPCKLLWNPDVVLYNSADEFKTGHNEPLAMIDANGTVFCPPLVRFRSICAMDVSDFPFDSQSCTLKIGPWAYTGLDVDVIAMRDHVDLSYYTPSSEWDIVSTTAVRNNIFYPCCPEPFPDVTFTVHLRRKYMYDVVQLLVPCIMLSVMSAYGLTIPPASGEKITMQVLVFVALLTFSIVLGEGIPESANIPHLAIYYSVVVVMTTIGTITTLLVSCIYFSDENKPVPELVQKIFFRYIGEYLGITQTRPELANQTKEPMARQLDDDTLKRAESPAQYSFRSGTDRQYQTVTGNGGDDTDDNCSKLEWKLLAYILDRLTFYLFFTITVIYSMYFALKYQ